MAAGPASAGSVAALDAKNGFQFLSLGTPISEVGKCKFMSRAQKTEVESIFQVGDFLSMGSAQSVSVSSIVSDYINMYPVVVGYPNIETEKSRCLASMQALGFGSAGWLPEVANVGDSVTKLHFVVRARGGKIVEITVWSNASSDLTKAMNIAYGIPEAKGTPFELRNLSDGYCLACTYRWRGRNVVATAEAYGGKARDYDQTGIVRRESWTVKIAQTSYVDAVDALLADQKKKEEQRKLQQSVDGL